MEEEWHEGWFRPFHIIGWCGLWWTTAEDAWHHFLRSINSMCSKKLNIGIYHLPAFTLCHLHSINLVSVNLFTIKSVSILHALPVLKSTWIAKPILLSYLRFSKWVELQLEKCRVWFYQFSIERSWEMDVKYQNAKHFLSLIWKKIVMPTTLNWL